MSEKDYELICKDYEQFVVETANQLIEIARKLGHMPPPPSEDEEDEEYDCCEWCG